MGMRGLVQQYFEAWLKKDAAVLEDLLSEHIVYSECYGPEYFGRDQVLRWFHDWNREGTVLDWEITRFVEQEKLCVAQWHFACEYRQVGSAFDGVSIIAFDDDHKMVDVKEFQSKKEHVYPYGRP